MTTLEVATNKTLSLLSQVDGRDKVYKSCQYGARLVWWMLYSKGADPKLLQKFSGLDGSFSEARRVFRLGGFIRGAKDLMREPFVAGNTSFLYSFKFLSTLSNFIAESMDVFIWGSKIKVVNVDKKRWDWWRNVMWMVTIWYSVIDQIVLMRQLLARRKYLLQQKSLLEYSDTTSPQKYTEKYTTSNTTTITTSNTTPAAIWEKKIRLNSDLAELHDKITNTIYSYIRYGCDFYMCSALLADREHKGVFGLLGVISGVLGVKQSWKRL